MTTLTPPPTDAAAPLPGAPTPPPTRSTARVIAIATVALGSALLVGAVTTGIVRTVAASAADTGSESSSVAVEGVTMLDVDANASDLTIVFADVDEALLEVDRGRTGWQLERDGDELQVTSPDSGWFGISFFTDDYSRATLTLPESMEGTDASLSLSAGSLRASGSFADLRVDVSAGDATVEGDARAVSVEVGAGSADLRLEDVATAALNLSAGEIAAELSGDVPREVGIDVGAGSLDLVLPRGDYDVRSDISAGDLDNRLERRSAGATGLVDVRISAGDVTLISGS
jgi:hypothetical protein